jgi:hypothetical protein
MSAVTGRGLASVVRQVVVSRPGYQARSEIGEKTFGMRRFVFLALTL